VGNTFFLRLVLNTHVILSSDSSGPVAIYNTDFWKIESKLFCDLVNLFCLCYERGICENSII